MSENTRKSSESRGSSRSSHQGGSGSRQERRRPRRRFRTKKKDSGCGPRCVGRQGVTIGYKEVKFLEGYLTPHGKIRPRRQTGNCAKHQRQLSRAIKRARYLALLPFAPSHDFTNQR